MIVVMRKIESSTPGLDRILRKAPDAQKARNMLEKSSG